MLILLLSLSAVSCCLVKLLIELKLELGSFDEALLLEGVLPGRLGDGHGGRGFVAQLPGDQPHPQSLHELLKVLALSQLILASAGCHVDCCCPRWPLIMETS